MDRGSLVTGRLDRTFCKSLGEKWWGLELKHYHVEKTRPNPRDITKASLTGPGDGHGK